MTGAATDDIGRFGMENLNQLFASIQNKHVTLIGDIYLDEYIYGEMNQISAEGPYPVVHSNKRISVPSAAGHAAVLMQGFGLQVHLIGIVGKDANGLEAIRLLQEKGIDTTGVLIDAAFTTNCRTRISVAGSRYSKQEVLQVETLKPPAIEGERSIRMLEHLQKQAVKSEGLVVLDKDQSVVTASAIPAIRQIAEKHRLLLVGDSEQQTKLLTDFGALTPNEPEAREALGDGDDPVGIGTRLRDKLRCGTLFMTRGAKGISVFEESGKVSHLPTEAREVFDVSGAGETVLAAITAGMIAGRPPVEVAQLANLAAGVAVAKPGLSEVSIDEILEFNRRLDAEMEAEKLVTLSRLMGVVQRAKSEGKKVVWTNGCFDIMHVGHILYLEKARSLGDMLIVGLNSDASVRASKGPARPIVVESQRAKLLTAMTCVDYVTIFDEQTPIKLLEALRPDVYAKGGDYTMDTINQDERRLVESYGGEIALMPGVEGMSTTNLIEKILQSYQR